MAHGAINHIEFPADDPERAIAFYEAVAGWRFQKMDGAEAYWMTQTAEGYGAAIGQRGQSAGTVVRDYIEVTSLDDALAAAEEHGGMIQLRRAQTGMGSYGVVIDPEGTEIGLFEPTPRG